MKLNHSLAYIFYCISYHAYFIDSHGACTISSSFVCVSCKKLCFMYNPDTLVHAY